uniref:Transposase n=1 Tax=Streptomyces ipomoeae 91-03 TaxID=698759 RepID=I3P645_9ACTN|nr:transposase [Streptomyces ipomoeae 91-03]
MADVFALLLPQVDERQRRLVLGAAARVLGLGGIRVAAGCGRSCEVHGVPWCPRADGRRGADWPGPGGGRKRLRDADPVLVPTCWHWSGRTSEVIRSRRCGWTVKATRTNCWATSAVDPLCAPRSWSSCSSALSIVRVISVRCSAGTAARHILPEPGAFFSLPSTRSCAAMIALWCSLRSHQGSLSYPGGPSAPRRRRMTLPIQEVSGPP